MPSLVKWDEALRRFVPSLRDCKSCGVAIEGNKGVKENFSVETVEFFMLFYSRVLWVWCTFCRQLVQYIFLKQSCRGWADGSTWTIFSGIRFWEKAECSNWRRYKQSYCIFKEYRCKMFHCSMTVSGRAEGERIRVLQIQCCGWVQTHLRTEQCSSRGFIQALYSLKS